MPPPICGDEAQKKRWARELEISRKQLDDMSPKDFKQAWEARNQRMRDAGVFDRLGDLYDTLGAKAVEKLLPERVDPRGVGPARSSERWYRLAPNRKLCCAPKGPLGEASRNPAGSAMIQRELFEVWPVER